MRVLGVTNMWPTEAAPWAGVFIHDQVESIRARGVDLEVMFVDRLDGGLRRYRAVPADVSAAMANGFDLVHSFYGGILAWQSLRGASGRPFLVSFCGSDLLGESEEGTVARMSAALGVRASRYVARRADQVIVKSAELAGEVRDLRPANRTAVIPNGVCLDRFRPLDRRECRDRLGWDPRRRHVLFAGRPRPVKRPELARSAIKHMTVDHVELHIPTSVPHGDLPLWLNAADAVLLTSRHEGSPNIVKEALACNVPIVSVPVGDVPDRLAGLTGCHVVQDNPEALARALDDVLRGRGRIESRARVAALSLDRVAQEITELYSQAVRGRNQSRCPNSPGVQGNQ